ncbi:ISL3 family transposase [Rhodocytophaga aerolata]|uniref:ISL3 family transposase n=1 Tax=Rhodocytophaga aerolata TaxID=455078 RepID=A0ABT8RHE3_9BACT|nr:ISL3 family transposase [Rhodocytophaga aerolata]MDO1451136.1 ISL3 family transposase [Rhodocytophaga aerolata]
MSTSHHGICPLCRQPSSRIHSYYSRKVTDLPISGKSVHLLLHARKFFCAQACCPRKIFTERWGGDLMSYQRRLNRATAQIRSIALMMGGNPGTKLTHLLGLPVSASTVLRILKQTSLPSQHTPKAVGVDDFAFKKGRIYGTILVDLEKRKPLELLQDREGKTLEDWLKAHPGIELLTRDRSFVYANAITAACPQAVQVADRWHLLKNLSEQWERLLDSQRTLIGQTALEIGQTHLKPSVQLPDLSSVIAKLEQANVGDDLPSEKRYGKYQQVKQLQEEGHSMRAIARHLAMSRRTVGKYFNQERFVPKTKTKRSNLLKFDSYLLQRWKEGEANGNTLLREIRALGYTGSYPILRNWLANYPPRANEQGLPIADRRYAYSNRSLSFAFCQAEKEWDTEKKPLLEKLLQKSPLLQQARELSLEFKSLMEQKKGECLENWCQRAGQFPAFAGFVRGIGQDFQAVQQAFSSSWSNGQTEGQVNRLKTIKRQMYGRASFTLLRLRVLADSG